MNLFKSYTNKSGSLKLKKIQFIPPSVREWYLSLTSPLIDFFIKRSVHPNYFTLTGLFISAVAGAAFFYEDLFLGGWLIFLGGTCDIIDGKVARATGQGSKFGALFDSVMDRYSEVFVFMGMGAYFIKQDLYITAFVLAFAVLGSLMVSYTRARAEGLGLECKVGFAQRPERILALGMGAIFGETTLVIAIWTVTIAANITAIHRILHVWNQTKNDNETGN